MNIGDIKGGVWCHAASKGSALHSVYPRANPRSNITRYMCRIMWNHNHNLQYTLNHCFFKGYNYIDNAIGGEKHYSFFVTLGWGCQGYL